MGQPEVKAEARGLWRYAPVLPSLGEHEAVWLGEGVTPLVQSRTVAGVWWKEEGANPAGSIWARGAAVAVSVARAAGTPAVRLPPPGDQATALAAYSAAGGLTRSVEGANLLESEAWQAGLSTLALELMEELGWQLPGAVVWAGAGDGGLAALRTGFAHALDQGWVRGSMPQLPAIALEQDRWAPLVREVAEAEGVVLSAAGACGAAAARQGAWGQDVVVVNGRRPRPERWLGVEQLPGRVPVGGIITPA